VDAAASFSGGASSAAGASTFCFFSATGSATGLGFSAGAGAAAGSGFFFFGSFALLLSFASCLSAVRAFLSDTTGKAAAFSSLVLTDTSTPADAALGAAAAGALKDFVLGAAADTA
jgi:hypothetical protein